MSDNAGTMPPAVPQTQAPQTTPYAHFIYQHEQTAANAPPQQPPPHTQPPLIPHTQSLLSTANTPATNEAPSPAHSSTLYYPIPPPHHYHNGADLKPSQTYRHPNDLFQPPPPPPVPQHKSTSAPGSTAPTPMNAPPPHYLPQQMMNNPYAPHHAHPHSQQQIPTALSYQLPLQHSLSAPPPHHQPYGDVNSTSPLASPNRHPSPRSQYYAYHNSQATQQQHHHHNTHPMTHSYALSSSGMIPTPMNRLGGAGHPLSHMVPLSPASQQQMNMISAAHAMAANNKLNTEHHAVTQQTSYMLPMTPHHAAGNMIDPTTHQPIMNLYNTQHPPPTTPLPDTSNTTSVGLKRSSNKRARANTASSGHPPYRKIKTESRKPYKTLIYEGERRMLPAAITQNVPPSEVIIPVKIRVMGGPPPQPLYFVASDLSALIHSRKSNIAKAVSPFPDHEKGSMSILCSQSNGTVSTHALTVLSVEGVHRLLTFSCAPISLPLLSWIDQQINLMHAEVGLVNPIQTTPPTRESTSSGTTPSSSLLQSLPPQPPLHEPTIKAESVLVAPSASILTTQPPTPTSQLESPVSSTASSPLQSVPNKQLLTSGKTNGEVSGFDSRNSSGASTASSESNSSASTASSVGQQLSPIESQSMTPPTTAAEAVHRFIINNKNNNQIETAE